MTQKETNSLNMIDGTMSYLQKHAAEWNAEAVIQESVTYISDRRTKIEGESKLVLERQTKGITGEINAGVNAAIDLAYVMAKRIALFAKKSNNLVLLNEVNFAKSELDDGTFKDITDRLDLISKRGNDNLAALGIYKVKKEDINALNAAIDAVRPKPADRKSTTAEHVEGNATVKLVLKEILKKMNDELDDEIEVLCDNKEFIAGYFAVRRTDDRRGRGKAVVPPPVPPTA